MSGDMGNYDAWKLATPPEHEGDADHERALEACQDDCWHDDREVDFLTGRATCDRCHHTWSMSPLEMEAWEASEIAYWAEEDRRWRAMRFERAIEPLLRPFRQACRWLGARWTPARIALFGYRHDDEIPF